MATFNWTIGEGSGEAPGGDNCDSIMTLGYDPQTKRFVGTFIASMMTHLWPYNGTLDAAGKVLTLDSEGPSLAGDGTMAKYQDMIEFLSNDHRTLSSQVLGADGQWQPFMKAHYRRNTSNRSRTPLGQDAPATAGDVNDDSFRQNH